MYIMCRFCLTVFKSFLFLYVFHQFNYDALVFTEFVLLGIHWYFWLCKSIFHKIWSFYSYFIKYHFCTNSSLLILGLKDINVKHLASYHKPLKLNLFVCFKICFSSLQVGKATIDLPPHSLFHFSSSFYYWTQALNSLFQT